MLKTKGQLFRDLIARANHGKNHVPVQILGAYLIFLPEFL
jgi:hypothetical protein